MTPTVLLAMETMTEEGFTAALIAAFLSFFLVYYLIALAIGIVMIVAEWRILAKADLPGWSLFVPFYNVYCQSRLLFGNGWLFLLYFVPVVNIVLALITPFRLAKVFDKGFGYGLGLLFLSPFFIMGLGFGDAMYTGPN